MMIMHANRCQWYWCTDIDECSTAQGASCLLNNGACDGFNPPGGFTCQCGTGYHMAENTTNQCVGNDHSLLTSRSRHCLVTIINIWYIYKYCIIIIIVVVVVVVVVVIIVVVLIDDMVKQCMMAEIGGRGDSEWCIYSLTAPATAGEDHTACKSLQRPWVHLPGWKRNSL